MLLLETKPLIVTGGLTWHLHFKAKPQSEILVWRGFSYFSGTQGNNITNKSVFHLFTAQVLALAILSLPWNLN
jgi:hypothetical protein